MKLNSWVKKRKRGRVLPAAPVSVSPRGPSDTIAAVTRPLFLFLTLLVLSCSSKTAWEYMPDMADSPAWKAQEADPQAPHNRAMRMPVEGTIPRNYQPYLYKGDPEGAAKNLVNPLPRTPEVLASGQKLFNIYCAVCHGTSGQGDGSVVPPFPRPPSLHSDKVRDWPDGRIFHVVTEGQNMMPSYASQVDADGRWAMIHYLRVLQRSENPSAADVEAYKQYRRQRKQKAGEQQ